MLSLFSYIRTSNDKKCIIAINRQYKIMNNDYCTENYDEEIIKKNVINLKNKPKEELNKFCCLQRKASELQSFVTTETIFFLLFTSLPG